MILWKIQNLKMKFTNINMNNINNIFSNYLMMMMMMLKILKLKKNIKICNIKQYLCVLIFLRLKKELNILLTWYLYGI